MGKVRKIVRIDETKCNGCGECAPACHEGAIRIIDGKAKLVSEAMCDGLGDCLGKCPQDAIRIEEREAEAFDEKTVAKERGAKKEAFKGCPGSMMRKLLEKKGPAGEESREATPSQLANWPVQLKLAPVNAPYFKDADLLLVADCVPFSLADFHKRFLRRRPVVIGCPKLDDAEFYVEKLAELLKASRVKSLTVVHMEVPCCSGLSYIAREAMARSGKAVPLGDVTVSIDGEVLSEEK